MGISFVAAMTMIVVAAAATGSAAQSTPECASKLVGCAKYLNSTTPPDTCCGPLKQEAKDDLPCLCALFNNTAVLKAFNVNITQALQMAKSCGVNADQRACATGTASPSGGATPPSSSTNTTSKSDSSAHGVTSIGLPGLVTLLLCWWSLITQE
ncbi:lipid transfer-like protein [Musa troglodytarum]|uniref:Lipid transfer-like protein n=1 Tax=Musa troglodytarum TaxID=320322 RepID=A0A9E7HEK9_9LILI|nr:lipid transfer-like protein [Musa troglodytarum]